MTGRPARGGARGGPMHGCMKRPPPAGTWRAASCRAHLGRRGRIWFLVLAVVASRRAQAQTEATPFTWPNGARAAVSLSFDDQGLELGRDRTADHVVASATEWAALLFGSHRERPTAVPEALSSLVPFALPVWTLDRS